MQIGMIGLGRMGANMARRLIGGGHDCVAFDVDPSAVSTVASAGARGAASLVELVAELAPPRVAWIMLPAAFVDTTIDELVTLLEPGDLIVDGGNSYYRDDIDRAVRLRDHAIHYVDVGTSGGVFGLERGFCLMIGGEDEPVRRLTPVFATLAPGDSAAPRTVGRDGPPSPAEQGYLHCGPSGAGHFVKMVHNGIEYGLMAAFAEGFNILHGAGIGMATEGHHADAETAPVRDPDYYRYTLDLPAVAELWRRGSVVSSWLLDLIAHALASDTDLARFEGRVADSGEGRWTALAAIDEGVPAPVLTSALFERFASRGNADFADRLLSAMRYEFGGHAEVAP
jgi:6-phosphogluconate dehydrogenase